MRSSRTAISDDEASDFSSEPNVNFKSDKKGKGKGRENPVVEASPMVESDDNEDDNEEDDDEEIAEDELVHPRYYGRRSLIDWLAGMW
jgi:hypothetical protein